MKQIAQNYTSGEIALPEVPVMGKAPARPDQAKKATATVARLGERGIERPIGNVRWTERRTMQGISGYAVPTAAPLGAIATSRAIILWLVMLVIVGSTSCALSADETVLEPGQNIQQIVENSPEGTRFRFEPGIYRQQTIRPKDQQKFNGQDGVILSGAMELTNWTDRSELWESERLPYPLRSENGECEDGRELCRLREDLFFNGRLYERVKSLDGLGPQKWLYQNRRAYLADDPTGQTVELSVTPLAFGGNAEDVVLEDLVIEKYASPAQHGAVHLDDGRGWQILNLTVRWNHGTGLRFGPQTHVEGGSFSHNGQLGIGGKGNDVTIEGAEISFNNYAGYRAAWEAGGTKFALTKGLVVRDSCVHHNNGPGLWTDIDNIYALYEGNKVFLNADEGIKHEISYDAIIHNNVVAENGTSRFNVWLWGSQILIQNSSNVKVYRNLVEVSGKFGNGIGVIQQDRGGGAYGPWNAINNLVHHNTIVHLGDRGQNGIVTDTEEDWFWKKADNRFDLNTYIVADRTGKYWISNERDNAWNDLEDLGLERHGKLIIERRAPTRLSCD